MGETLLPLIDDDTDAAVAAATDVLMSFADRFRAPLAGGHACEARLVAAADGDQQLFDDLLP